LGFSRRGRHRQILGDVEERIVEEVEQDVARPAESENRRTVLLADVVCDLVKIIIILLLLFLL
jgi:hypothetical protein